MKKTPRNQEAHARNVAIWEETGSPAALLEANRGLVVQLARRHATKLNRFHLVDDYIQAASIGFLHAFKVKPWDPDKGTIGTFVTMWMFSQMQSLVDRHEGFSGFSASHSMVQGTTEDRLPFVDSWHRDVSFDGTRPRTLEQVTPDPKGADSYEEVERRLAAEQDFKHLRDSVPVEYREVLDAMLTESTVQAQCKLLRISNTTLVKRKEGLREWVAIHYTSKQQQQQY